MPPHEDTTDDSRYNPPEPVRAEPAREDMAEDGRIDDKIQISRLMAIQLVTSFNQNYDERSVSYIEDLRRRSKSNFARRIVDEYDEYRELVYELKARYNL